MGKPFLPFQQLLAVLPAASKELLPIAYHSLMTETNSKLIEYYPVDFETDLNGKKQEWEAVVLIPFIDEDRLLDAMNDCAPQLSDSERQRNIHGPMLKYHYTQKDLGVVPETRYGQPEIRHNFCEETPVWRDEVFVQNSFMLRILLDYALFRLQVRVPDDKLVLGPSKGVANNVYFPGFPTMRHLKYTVSNE